MNETASSELDTFFRMAREFPIRTGIYSFGLPVFALLQLLNGVVNGGSLLLMAGLAAFAIVCAVLVTQYHVAVYRRQQLTSQWF